MSTPAPTKTSFLEAKIREGFTSEDVRLWQSLCRQCETLVGDSVQYMFTIIDMARHNGVDVFEIVKTGRLCSEQKNINEKFMEALFCAVASDNEGDDNDVDDKKVKVLDLTADEELSESGSYEEETDDQVRGKVTVLNSRFHEDEMYNDNPNSNEAYEIDGFVVPDHHSDPETSGVEIVKPRKRLLKRKLELNKD